MREMKDSGLSWLGKIPVDWDVRKVKELYSLQTGFTPDTSNENYYSDKQNGYEWLNIGDLSDEKIIPSTTKKYISQEYIDKFNPQIIPSGSLLYSFKLSVGQVAFTDREIYSNEAISSFLNKGNVNLEFLYYSSFMIIHNANENIYGAKILNQQLIKNAYIVFPPLNEQRMIVDYLDKKCLKIDESIKSHENVIKKLEEYRKSLIEKCVTNGINHNRNIKTINGEFITYLPEEWNIEPLKFKFKFSKGLSITKENLQENGLPVISYGQIHSKTCDGVHVSNALIRFVSEDYSSYKNSQVDKTGFIFADTSEDLDGCGNAIYNESLEKLYAGYHCIVLNPYVIDETNKYFAYLFRTDVWRKQIRDQLVDVKLFSISQKSLKETKITVPPKKERMAIAEYLDEKCCKIDGSIQKHKEIIEKLQEYRKSLVYNAVTGKIDCREEENEA